jgi:valyl-tRNA synthetase
MKHNSKMSIDKKYNPSEVESKWYQTWMDKNLFHAEVNPDKEAYSVVIPPPNVTGVLHMGHMLNNTIQDVLVRKARMEGKEACWVPGTDHASIATETKVVNLLAEQGIKKTDITRDEFLGHAFEWKDKYGGIILEQLKKLGASCDWERTKFTMDDDMSESVIKTFVDLHKKGLIYRGVRMVNWDPKGLTALSDEEVIHKEVNSKLFYIKYKIVGEENFITIATTRPETILGDSAICVNPNDARYKHLAGKKILVPLVNREIPVIFDEYVDLEFGTGCLKVTPAHDINDYELGLRHKLEVIDVLNDNGTISEAGGLFVGENRFVARKKVIKALEEIGQFEKFDEIKNSVGYSERTNEVIEPKLSAQWFCKMTDLAKPALENVENDNIQIHPPKFKNMYRSWMENVRDWCISRQLWWGHRIPAYYLPNGEVVVAESEEEALVLAQAIDSKFTIEDLKQDEDVLDTWFSSWLWPMSVFDGINNPDNEEFKYFYPTNDLVTGFDIIFFWVARMVMAGYEFPKELPFKNVYITGMVRDEKGRKMSKSLGNSPDPLDLIAKYSADGVRAGMLFSAPAGNDLLFNEKLCEQGSRFTNKIWNAFRLVHDWDVTEQTVNDDLAISIMKNKINSTLIELKLSFDAYRMSEAVMTLYKLIWDDFCSVYLEQIKPGFEEPIAKSTYEATVTIFEDLMKMLHPFMPFITEEIYSQLAERAEGDYIMIAEYPKGEVVDASITEEASFFEDVITGIRNLRIANKVPGKEQIELSVKAKNGEAYSKFEAIIKKTAGISAISFVNDQPEQSASFVAKGDEIYIPIPEVLDIEGKKEELNKELKRAQGLLTSVLKKLSNERFVQNAPEKVLAMEKKKQEDSEAKIKALEESLASLR